MKDTLIRKFERYYEEESWPEARLAVLKLLRKDPENHWFLTRLSSIYHEERKYELALKAVKKAY